MAFFCCSCNPFDTFSKLASWPQAFVSDQRNVVLVGGTGTRESHLAIAIARALIRNSTRGRFFNLVDRVNRHETETRNGEHELG